MKTPIAIIEDLKNRSEAIRGTEHNPQSPHKERKLLNREKELLFPCKALQTEFKPYLKKTNTKLARLYPNEKYAAALGIYNAWTQYSFKNQMPVNELTNTASSLLLEKGKFITQLAGVDLRFLLNLGDIEIENVMPDRAELKFLLKYKPSNIESEVRKDGLLLHSGIVANGFIYKREVVATPNNTYIMRNIAFYPDPTLAYDFLIVFRTLRQLDDGSYIFAWKILKKFPTPQLKRKY